LARELDIGRGALREAISRMEGLQLLKREPNLGVRVYDFAAEIEHILVVREAIEGMACRIAATTISHDELALLGKQVSESVERAKQGRFETTSTDDFHFIIARASRNPRIIHLVCDNLAFQLRLAWHGAITHPGRFVGATQEHAEILAALEARDPDRSEAAMRRHIANTRNYAAAVQRREAEIRSDLPEIGAVAVLGQPELTVVAGGSNASTDKP
jgi:DNA-binding GntR family transcriptional regulator